jgi:DNA polymerase-4
MQSEAQTRRILHLDLAPFFVAVERARDATLRGRPVVVGGDGPQARVAAVSDEAQAAGVRAGQAVSRARELCPEAAVRPGDLEAYARVSNDVTSLLLRVSRRVERPSADEAFIDLSSHASTMRRAVLTTESLRHDMQRQLGLDAALGLASSRLAARVASRWARPRGLVLLLPQHEEAFLGHQPLALLDDLAPVLLARLAERHVTTFRDVRAADPAELDAALGRSTADRLRRLLDPSSEPAVSLMAPPLYLQEDLAIRDRTNDPGTLRYLLDGLVARACRRLQPFSLAAGSVTVEVRRGDALCARSERLRTPLRDEQALRSVAARLGGPLMEAAPLVRALRVRLAHLDQMRPSFPLFPEVPLAARA